MGLGVPNSRHLNPTLRRDVRSDTGTSPVSSHQSRPVGSGSGRMSPVRVWGRRHGPEGQEVGPMFRRYGPTPTFCLSDNLSWQAHGPQSTQGRTGEPSFSLTELRPPPRPPSLRRKIRESVTKDTQSGGCSPCIPNRERHKRYSLYVGEGWHHF